MQHINENSGTWRGIAPAPTRGRRLFPRQSAGLFSSDRQKFLTMLALIAYALFLAFLGGSFAAYVMQPLEIETRQVGTGLRDISPECWAAPDLFNCLNYLEPQ